MSEHDPVAEKFAEHVKQAAMQLLQEVPNLHPQFANEATELGGAILTVFATPDFMHGFNRWMTIVSMVHSATSCDCENESKHEFLRTCDGILSGHTMTWQLDVFRDLLVGLELPAGIIAQVVEAMAAKMTANLTKVEKVEVPDFVPADWDREENDGK